MPRLVPLGKGSLEQGDHLLVISDMIKEEKEKLESEIDELIDQKLEEFEIETRANLRPIKLDLTVEENDIRMKKYFQMVLDFEKRYVTARDSVDSQKHKVLNMHHECERISQKVRDSQILAKVAKIKNNLVEVIKSPSFASHKDECIKLAESVGSSLQLDSSKVSDSLLKIDQLLLEWQQGLNSHLKDQKKSAKRSSEFKAGASKCSANIRELETILSKRIINAVHMDDLRGPGFLR